MADSSDLHEQPSAAASHAEFFSPAHLERRRRAMEQQTAFQGVDDLDPKLPAGHAYAIRTSTRLTSYIKRHHRKAAMDITPQDVIDVLTSAGVKNWVLMGLHGYVGYMPDPRATQDVDIMVPYSSRARAKRAIAARWPELVIRELSQVTRFMDTSDLDPAGHPKPVIDLMHPLSAGESRAESQESRAGIPALDPRLLALDFLAPFQELILKEYVVIDDQTQHRLPTLEAALVSKYASMLSPFRDRDKKEEDAVDFRRLARANRERIQPADLRRLAVLVWEGGGDELVRFIQIALSDEAFPI